MNYYWEESEFLTGDNIESLGDYIFDIGNYIDGDHGRTKTSKTEQELIEEQINYINYYKPLIIYCYGHDTHRLLKNIDKIKYRFKLITHNSDIGILEEYKALADNDKIIKWFGQNNYIKHPKTVSLPIAIARKKYTHGNTNLLSNVSKNIEKTNICYKNFTIETNLNLRNYVNEITTKNGIIMAPRCNHAEYLNNISKSIFVISPPGNGIDCHRIWECLYLKTIPVVQYHIAFEQFKDLPILFINNWSDVTYDILKTKISMLDFFSDKKDKLSFNYWKDLITSHIY